MADDGCPQFSALLRQARRDAGLTQEALAEHAGISTRAISDLERGINRAPRQDTLDLLANALGLPPDERRRWEQARRRVARSAPNSQPRSPSRAGPRMPVPPALLVGRDRELRVLSGVLDDMLTGHGRLVLLSGEAGIGKTAVAGALAHRASAAGAPVLLGHCYDLTTTPPYGPWLEALRSWVPPAGLSVLPAALRDDAGIAGLASQPALFDAVAGFLRFIAAHRPLLLILEDLHWADSASLDLLRFVGRRIGDVPLLLVGTYRSDELHRRHPLMPVLPALVREADVHRIELPRLADSEVADLTASRYGLAGGEQGRLVEHIQRHAEGLVLYVCELLRTLEEEAVLRRDETGAWTLGDLGTLRVPRLVHEVIEARVARLPGGTQAALAVAAVIGQDVPLDIWARVSDTAEDALLEVADEAVAARLLVAAPDGQAVRFAHALVREALYDGVLPLRRRVWHRATAEALLERTDPDPDVVATHVQRAGDPRAAEWLVRAGERAIARYAWVGAAERFEAALELITDLRQRGWLLYRIGRLLRYADPGQSIRYLGEAEALAQQIGDRALRAFAVADTGLAMQLGHQRRAADARMAEGIGLIDQLTPDDIPDAFELLRIIEERTIDPGDQPERLELPKVPAHWNPRLGTYVLSLSHLGRLADASAIGEPLARDAESVTPWRSLFASPLGLAWQKADLWGGLAKVYALTGRPDTADDAFSRARALYASIQHHAQAGLGANYQLIYVTIPFRTTDLDMRHRLLDDAEMRMTQSYGSISAAGWHNGQLHVLLLEGAWSDARAIGERMFASPDWAHVLDCICALARDQGRVAEAWDMLRRGLPDGPDSEPDRTPFDVGVRLLHIAAELALGTDDLGAAAEWISAHRRWLDDSGATVFRPDQNLLLAGYERAVGRDDRALAHAERALTLASDPTQPLAILAAHRILGGLRTAAELYGAADQHLQESLALADACAAPFERALTLLALAELRMAEGRRDETRALAGEARAICEPLGARPTLDRLDELLRRLGPSPLVPT